MSRLMIKGLHHKYAWAADDTKFFAHIDECGGWPVGYRYVGFSHTDEREAGFTNSQGNDGWWTVIADSDAYYLWKLSAEAKKRFADAVIKSVRITLTAETIDVFGGIPRYTKVSLKEPKQ